MSIDQFTYQSIATAQPSPTGEIDFEKKKSSAFVNYVDFFDRIIRDLGLYIQSMPPDQRIKASGLLRRFAGAAMGPVSYENELDDIRHELIRFLFFGAKS